MTARLAYLVAIALYVGGIVYLLARLLEQAPAL